MRSCKSRRTATAGLAGVVISLALAIPAQASVTADTAAQLVSRQDSSLCLTLQSAEDAQTAVAASCAGSATGQSWIFTAGGQLQAQLGDTLMCLVARGTADAESGMSGGLAVDVAPCGSAAAQHGSYTAEAGTFTNAATEQCLSLPSDKSGDSGVVTADCSAGASAGWDQGAATDESGSENPATDEEAADTAETDTTESETAETGQPAEEASAEGSATADRSAAAATTEGSGAASSDDASGVAAAETSSGDAASTDSSAGGVSADVNVPVPSLPPLPVPELPAPPLTELPTLPTACASDTPPLPVPPLPVPPVPVPPVPVPDLPVAVPEFPTPPLPELPTPPVAVPELPVPDVSLPPALCGLIETIKSTVQSVIDMLPLGLGGAVNGLIESVRSTVLGVTSMLPLPATLTGLLGAILG
jgi:hypothetical protein